MNLSFRCTNTGCFAGVRLIVFAVVVLLAPAAYGVWRAVRGGLL